MQKERMAKTIERLMQNEEVMEFFEFMKKKPLYLPDGSVVFSEEKN